MVRYESSVIDLTDGVQYYKWSDTYQWSNLLGAWNLGGQTFLKTFVDYNNDYVLGVL